MDNAVLIGLLIRQRRLKNNWSQEGLSKGICSVSYLSKIEQGKADASGEVMKLLLERLGLKWYDDENTVRRAKELSSKLYDAIFSMLPKSHTRKLLDELTDKWEVYSCCPYFIELSLERANLEDSFEPDLPQGSHEYFNKRQKELYYAFLDQLDELPRFSDTALGFAGAGYKNYTVGNYSQALDDLLHAARLSQDEGRVHLTLFIRLTIAGCYANMGDLDQMDFHHAVARRIAQALDDEDSIYTIDYNTAATHLERGDAQRAYDYFSKVRHIKSKLNLHKLAICCERLGKKEEALEALETAQSCEYEPVAISNETLDWMLAIIEYRLKHPDHLSDPNYGQMLLSGFENLKKNAPSGFIRFHIPYVTGWYTANRQYKQAYELLRDFPDIGISGLL